MSVVANSVYSDAKDLGWRNRGKMQSCLYDLKADEPEVAGTRSCAEIEKLKQEDPTGLVSLEDSRRSQRYDCPNSESRIECTRQLSERRSQ